MKVWDGAGNELMTPGSDITSHLGPNGLKRLSAEKFAASIQRVKYLQIYKILSKPPLP